MKQLYLDKAFEITDNILSETTMSEPGGLVHWLHGRRPSFHSLYIKVGRNFEEWFKVVAEDCGMILLDDRVTKNVVGSKSKDIDFIFKCETTKTIYYYEQKSNIELDTEKLPATYNKVKAVHKYLIETYKGYEIKSSILHWSEWNYDTLPKKYHTKIKQCKDYGVSVSWPKDLFKTLGADISKKDYNSMGRKIGKKLEGVI